jgi:hypothetical protein
MNTIYVIVYSYDYKSIADNIYFSSYEEAYEWKKEQIANGECFNPISSYSFKALIPSSIKIELAEAK